MVGGKLYTHFIKIILINLFSRFLGELVGTGRLQLAHMDLRIIYNSCGPAPQPNTCIRIVNVNTNFVKAIILLPSRPRPQKMHDEFFCYIAPFFKIEALGSFLKKLAHFHQKFLATPPG